MSVEFRLSGGFRARVCLTFMAFLAGILTIPTLAQDVTRPAPVSGLTVDRDGDQVLLDWDPVTLDAAGQAETISHYNVYRGSAPDFIPDKAGGTNRIGQSPSESFGDDGAAIDGNDYYYLVSAVDTAGNESDTLAPVVHTPPVLSGYWTTSTIEVSWTDAEPVAGVVAYRVYYGRSPASYEAVDDVGLVNSHSLTALQPSTMYYIAVTALDVNGNESAFSNEHADVLAGIARVRAHDGDELCWGADDCIPTDPEKVLRRNGWQLMVPIDFPEGDWHSVKMSFTMESRLCTPPAQGTVTKCGSGNDCVSPPCNGGYNPCGDPWDRLAHVFLVLDDCIEAGGSCITPNNLELMRAITSFGTDAEPPDGTGVVPPRELTLDITPFAPLLTGRKYVGVDIGHYVQKGHWVTVDFEFSKNPFLVSPKPPADGIEIVGFGNAPLPTRQIGVPVEATQIKARVFTTGHGGSLYCDGGTNNAQPCTSQSQCPGGVCNPCDEFCHRTNSLTLDGAPIWEVIPYRTDCSPGPQCYTWNACGYPSCTYPRAGWCPGYIACHHNAPCDNDIDLTAEIPPGGTYDFDYFITPQNGSWPVSVVLFWYE